MRYFNKGFAPKAYEMSEVVAELTREVRKLRKDVERLKVETALLSVMTGLTTEEVNQLEEIRG